MNNFLKYTVFFYTLIISVFLTSCRESQPLPDVQPSSSVEKSENRILIVNSDTSVEKYATIQTEFESELSASNVTMVKLNLAKEKLDSSGLGKKVSEVNPSVIYTIGSKAYTTTVERVKDKPVIFSSMINWRRFPMTHNIYGISLELPAETELFMYSYLFPDIRRLGVLYSKSHNSQWFEEAVPQTKEVGLTLQGKVIEKKGDISKALKELLPTIDALWLISDPLVLNDTEQIKQIFEAAAAQRKPIFAYNTLFTDYGAILTISADIPTMGRQAATLAQDIVSKQNIGESDKVQFPAGSHISLNLKKAREYGIKINSEALSSVQNIIDDF
jgi:putative ABC transport system substrate-binding protein